MRSIQGFQGSVEHVDQPVGSVIQGGWSDRTEYQPWCTFVESQFKLFDANTNQYIKTAMGDMDDGDLTPACSAQAVLRRASDATIEDSGHFVDIEVPGYSRPDGIPKYTGKCLPY